MILMFMIITAYAGFIIWALWEHWGLKEFVEDFTKGYDKRNYKD